MRSLRRGAKAVKRRVGRSRAVVRLRRRRGQASRQRFYGAFVGAGDLVFDVGAHVGNRTAVFLELGARVVAVEPQEQCVAELRRSFARNERLTIVPHALAASEGTQRLFVSDASMLSSLSPEWIEGMQASGRFAEFSWDAGPAVETITLDTLIAEHGLPRFCKIDVEGYEEQVLAGLSTAVPMLSLEFQPERLEAAQGCVDRLL